MLDQIYPMTHFLSPRQAIAVNKVFLKVRPYQDRVEPFRIALLNLLAQVDESQMEEFHKNLVIKFFEQTFKGEEDKGTPYFINTKNYDKGEGDLVIHTGKIADSSVGVILEFKKPKSNNTEMPKPNQLNCKALQQLIFYFLQERLNHKNLEVRKLVITNIYEWFIFDAQDFEQFFVKSLEKSFLDFTAGRLTGKTTDYFYQNIAKPAIANIENDLKFVHFDLRSYQENLENLTDEQALVDLFKILSPEYLLKLPSANDSNRLDEKFYGELLHIMGLTVVKSKSKKLIERKAEKDRNRGSLLENVISRLQSLDKLSLLSEPLKYGETEDEQLFAVALALVIVWVNRILFLKLLEAQLVSYHKQDKANFMFLNIERIKNYDDLNQLFFEVLAVPVDKRDRSLQVEFSHIPYLNSSLFEPTDLEQETGIMISNLRDESLSLFSGSVLTEKGEMKALAYLFAFLNAYDFGSGEEGVIKKDQRRLINSSVLGLIFERINGYKDGSYFTPAFITMYMCRETIRRAIVQKFNEVKGWSCENLTDLYNEIRDKKEANTIINSLKICDPAVGSGHFLVSALNEMIVIKSELQVLMDREGRLLRDYAIEVASDELVIMDEESKFFEYNPKSKESQRVQETLFHEKQTIIENCLFGVDINENSVQICRLRLWIELLKNAYYKADNQLETLPNIDINIKIGNSLISRFPIDSDLKFVLFAQKNQSDIVNYKSAVRQYFEARTKQDKKKAQDDINNIKKRMKDSLQEISPKQFTLRRLESELSKLEGLQLPPSLDIQLEPLDAKAKKLEKEREKKIAKLSNEIDKLKVEIEEVESGRLYENALEWRFEFPEILNDQGDFVGFDVVIGNPPYIRQEEIKQFKSLFQQIYQSYTGVADLFVYFYERALQILKHQGYLTYISSNKYFRAGYGENLRRMLTSSTTIHQLIDFGDYPVFEEAIAYPSIIILKKEKSNDNQVKALVWNETKTLDIKDFSDVFTMKALDINQTSFKQDGWQLESKKVLDLLAKLKSSGQPLGEYVNGKFYYGIKTGFNEAFIINKETRDKLIAEHSSSAEIIKSFLRGRDVKRWQIKFSDHYLIKIESSENKKHPWSNQSLEEAESIFSSTYPAIYKRFCKPEFKDNLIKRLDQGKYFWELRSCAYWNEFNQPKILYPDIYNHQSFCSDKSGFYLGNTCYFIPTTEIWLCGLLNSQIVEWFYSMTSNSIRGGYLRAFTDYMKQIPVPKTTASERKIIGTLVSYLVYLAEKIKDTSSKDTPGDEKKIVSVADDMLILNYFEQVIDALILELYLPNELHKYNKYFMRYLLKEDLPDITENIQDKIVALRKIFKKIFDKEYPIRVNLYFLNTLETVRFIRGL